MRIIGLGQPVAGDDGIGHVLVAALRRQGLPAGVDLLEVAEPTALISLLETPGPVLILDAVVGAGDPGQVLVLTPEDLAPGGLMAVSSHGIGAAQAIALARTLSPDTVSPSIRLVVVTIDRPERYGQTLSPAVAAAMPLAVTVILEAIGGPPCTSPA